MVNIKAIKCVSQFNGCMVIRYQVFVTKLVLSFDLIDNQLGPLASSYCNPICLASWRLISKVLYSATLLEHGSVNEKARGRTWLYGKTNTTPTAAIILPLELVLDAPSKNICYTLSVEVMLASMTSSEMSSCIFEVSGTR